MTSRERWLAALQGEPMDHLPFWPKLNGAYPRNQQAPYDGMTNSELHDWIGSDPQFGGPNCVKIVRSETAVDMSREDGLRRTVYSTPVGELTAIERYDYASASYHPSVFPIKSPEDIDVMRAVFEDARPELDSEQLEEAKRRKKEIGGRGALTTSIGISPLMDWIQHLAGIENGHYWLIDQQERVEALFEAMHRLLCRKAEIVAQETPYEFIYSVENTSTTLISPRLFKQYCYRHLTDYGRIITAEKKFHMLHMCGKLKELLPEIDTLPAVAIEAFTSPPVGSTTLLDGRSDCPETCLIGGTNATLWLEPAEVIIEQIERDLSALPHRRRVIITSAGVMPPFCRPATIKRVADWLKTCSVH